MNRRRAIMIGAAVAAVIVTIRRRCQCVARPRARHQRPEQQRPGRSSRRHPRSARSLQRCSSSAKTACRFNQSSARSHSAIPSPSRRAASSKHRSAGALAARSAIPEGTKLRAALRHRARRCLRRLHPRGRPAKHTGASLDELFTVYSIVNALTVNLPAITRVQILDRRQGSRTRLPVMSTCGTRSQRTSSG